MGCNGSKAAAPAAGSVGRPPLGDRVAETLLEKRSAGPSATAAKKSEAVVAPEAAPEPEGASSAEVLATQEASPQEVISVLLPEEIQVTTSETAPNAEQQSSGEAPGASLSGRHASSPKCQTEDAGLDSMSISRERVCRDVHAAAKKEETPRMDLPTMWLPVNAIAGLRSHIGNMEESDADVVLSNTTQRPSSILASGPALIGLCNPCCGQAVDVNEETVMVPTEMSIQTRSQQ